MRLIETELDKDRMTACYAYVWAIKDILRCKLPPGVRSGSFEQSRVKWHDRLCELFGLAKEDTLKYTDNIDLNSTKAGEELYFNLLEESNCKNNI